MPRLFVVPRRILLTGLIVFGFASLLAAFVQTPAMLIGARVLLALGGSMIMPCVLGIIRRTFEDEGERAMALGLWGEHRVISMEMMGKIRRMYFCDKLSLHEITRRTGVGAQHDPQVGQGTGGQAACVPTPCGPQQIQ